MIEITLTEGLLFAWGIVATAYALQFHHEMNMAKFILKQIITDKGVRDQIVGAYEEHKGKMT